MRHLTQMTFYDNVSFHRVLAGFIAQFGISGRTSWSDEWWSKHIEAEPVVVSNERGTIGMAVLERIRSTQVYINLKDNSEIDKNGFAPFGRVVAGMEAADRLYAEYGDVPPKGRRGVPHVSIKYEGDSYLRRYFPKLDYVITARIVESDEKAAELIQATRDAERLRARAAKHAAKDRKSVV